MSRFVTIIFACSLVGCLICCSGFYGPQGELGDLIREDKLKHWDKSIDRFPDYDYFLVIEVTPEQWDRIRQRMKVDQEWHGGRGLIGWADWQGDPPRPDWWQEKNEAAPCWRRSLHELHLSQWIKYENGRVYYKEIKS